MRQRHLFGLELAVRSHGQYRIETRDWALEQLRAVRRLNRHAREERPAPDPRRAPRPEHSGLPRRVGFGLAGQVRRQAHVAKVQGLWSRDVLGGCGRTRSDRQEWNGHSTSWRREVFGPHWSGQVASSGHRRRFSAGTSGPTATLAAESQGTHSVTTGLLLSSPASSPAFTSGRDPWRGHPETVH
jgi:hypothetical protein